MARLIDKKLADEVAEITRGKTREELISIIEKQAVIIKQLRSPGTELETDCVGRQTVKKVLKDWYENLIVGSLNGLIKRIDAIPSTEPQIIRCRDCKHEFYCCNPCRKSDDGFCSNAERKEDD